MVDMNTLFGATYVLLWVLVIGESFLLFVLLRTIGHLLLSEQSIGVRDGIEVGKRLPDVAAGPGLLLELLPSRPYVAVVFTSPTCGYCPGAVEAVRHAVAGLPWLGATVLVRADERADELDGYANVAEWGSVATIAADTAEQLNLRATPFVMVVDGSAKVVAKGVVNDETHLAKLIEATERAMADPAPMTRG